MSHPDGPIVSTTDTITEREAIALNGGQVPIHTTCGICGQTDNHPKHVFTIDAGTGEETRRHMDCCAPLGCDLCAHQIMDAGGIQGHELRAHLVQKSAAAAENAEG